MATQPLDKIKIVVAIDFGTTFSGVAWAKVQNGEPYVIEQWPGSYAPLTGATSEKVPTRILYDDEEPEGIKWGFQIEPDVESHQWFKLDLESKYSPDTALSTRYPHSNILPPNIHHNAQQLTTDYLKALKKHLMYILELQLGALQAKITPLQFVLTVPAVWSDIAREKTSLAAKNAGLEVDEPLRMISEPEAAATYALQEQELRFLAPGDTFVICDAGGGTVDLISYTIVKLQPVLEVKEAAPGTGALCGSTYLNRRFQEFLESKLGKEQAWDNEVLADAMERFDLVIKRNYSSTSKSQTYAVPVMGLANNPALNIKRHKMYVDSEDIKAILQPVVDEAVKLVLEQIKTTQETQETKRQVKAILLVGGFGKSMYLRERIREAVDKKIEVLQPGYGWTAVVRGALMKGLSDADHKYTQVRVVSRSARKHIGTKCGIIFNEAIHSEDKKYFDGFSGCWRTQAMDWFIRKGDAINENIPYTFDFQRSQLVSLGRLTEFLTFIYCDRTDRPAVVYFDDEIVQLVRLKANIEHLPQTSSDIETGKDGKMYYVIYFKVEITYQSASTKYELLHKGKRYNAVTAEYV
ncbi:hypothetical protein VE00_06923 [Pseudogymnoascus sp. WSF 3629]|nr:hypothetical protein VE00_06923 [Pseudogymnoascus sp. WSF 3629]